MVADMRAKRGASQSPPETYGIPGQSPPRGASPPSAPRPSVPFYAPRPASVTPILVSHANPLGSKGRCVCCAPRKFGFPHFTPPRYGY
uniref:Uncharacterized protein n=1 Tax=Panagrolaimus superbus TaxID=310955 RepID=A0A914Y7H1_9BILA